MGSQTIVWGKGLHDWQWILRTWAGAGGSTHGWAQWQKANKHELSWVNQNWLIWIGDFLGKEWGRRHIKNSVGCGNVAQLVVLGLAYTNPLLWCLALHILVLVHPLDYNPSTWQVEAGWWDSQGYLPHMGSLRLAWIHEKKKKLHKITTQQQPKQATNVNVQP